MHLKRYLKEQVTSVSILSLVQNTRLLFGQGLVHAPVGDPERVTRELLLRVEELVKETDLLHEVAADRPHQVVEVVRAVSVRLRDPEADVVDARGLLTHWL